DRVQHELHAHEDHQGVAAHEDADRADDEQDHRKRYEVRRAHDRASSGSVPASSAWPPAPLAASPFAASPFAAPSPGGSDAAGPVPSSRSLAAMIGLTESTDGEPSGSRAGKSTALCLA